MNHYLAFYGTLTTIVQAENEADAYVVFCSQHFGSASRFGRVTPPTHDEVTIRRPRQSDRAWLEDSGSAEFVALLGELVP